MLAKIRDILLIVVLSALIIGYVANTVDRWQQHLKALSVDEQQKALDNLNRGR